MDSFADKVHGWSDRIHKWAVGKGWWEEGIDKRDFAAVVCNFHAEISEAWEEYRAGRMDLLWSVNGKDIKGMTGERVRKTDSGNPIIGMGWNFREGITNWKPAKPEGFWVEIGDLCIRVFDAMGAYGWEYEPTAFATATWIDSESKLISSLHTETAVFAPGFHILDVAASKVIDMSFGSAEANSVDLWELIEIKHCYNETRSYRHGGKKA